MYFPIIITLIEAVFAFFLLYLTDSISKTVHLLLAVPLICAAFLVRYYLLPYETADYQDFLSRWVKWFADNGGFSAMKDQIGNYNIPYLYFLALFSYLPVKDIYLIKSFSIFFDIILAYSVCMTVSLFSDNKWLRICSFSAVLLWPTVILNGAYWGQCDSIYTSLALLGIYCALSDKPIRSMVCIALSFSFKLQAVFIMPVYAVLLIKGKINWKHIAFFPITYIAAVLPAVLLGRPFIDTVGLYFGQMDSIGTGLNYNSPSVFSFWDHKAAPAEPVLMTNIGIALAFLFMFAVILVCFIYRHSLSSKSIVISAALFSTGIPFLLPRMHDRYFFPADILTLCLAFIVPQSAPCAILTLFASFLAYYAYLNMHYLLLMRWGACALIISMLILIVLFYSVLRQDKNRGISILENNP
ncbi:MAG: conjugal transfer protein TraL [Oscillospiraceae bacterium]|nr:conjugal transfer protein TraL [Oscillospiraceae bacterium]